MEKAVSTIVQSESSEREKNLQQYGYNVINIHPSLVNYDLMTDSWTELISDEMTDRMNDLRASIDFSTSGHLASNLFPFKHFLNVAQGRSAEAYFWKAVSKKDKKVVQNLLFPTSRMHLINNRMMPLELPVDHVLSASSNDLFRGNLDVSKLRNALQEQDGKDIAYIYIEAENNASGGYPVSMANVKEVSSIVADYSIPMVLDATRLVENAVLIQRNEKNYEHVSVQEIVREFCSYFQHMTCSLAKDFGITRGGLVATNDEKIFSRARDTAATFGPGINATDKAMINAVFNDLSFVETMVNRRVDQASRLHAACVKAGLPLFMPSSGHCLLFDTADYLDLSKYKNAVTAFTAWVYQESGVRGGMHVTGMMREFANAAMVRFAIPLCMPDEKIDALTDDFVNALKTMKNIPDMEKTSSMGGIFGQMHAEYKPV